MNIINSKYKYLTPDVKFLGDEAVLVQAWKKCDTFIRRHNWYADILELEKTSLMLPELIPIWSRQVKDKKVKPKQDMRLVLSYGNRLFCDWVKSSDNKQHARFRWGSGTTYSQFFLDYQRFLFRPAEVCHEAVNRLNKERLYVVKLDLSKFYDCIDRSELLDKIDEIFDEYTEAFDVQDPNREKFNEFCGLLKNIMDWKWSDSDLEKNDLSPKNGLPQGLVASGFFANAYMHKLDQNIGDLIGTKIKEGEDHYRLLDYCRYVDDMCIVVAVKNDLKVGKVGKIVSASINKKIKKQLKSLTLNETKTETIPWEDFAVQGSTSQFMRGVQKQISQAPDPITLANATGNIDHLLWLADTIDGEMNTGISPLELAHIAKPKTDVRDDTIQRFAANRLRTVLRLRRSMADSETYEDSSPVSEKAVLDHEIETIARKLIACFAKNPALTGVLRCGLDLFPSPDLLLPVLEALEAKLSQHLPTLTGIELN